MTKRDHNIYNHIPDIETAIFAVHKNLGSHISPAELDINDSNQANGSAYNTQYILGYHTDTRYYKTNHMYMLKSYMRSYLQKILFTND